MIETASSLGFAIRSHELENTGSTVQKEDKKKNLYWEMNIYRGISREWIFGSVVVCMECNGGGIQSVLWNVVHVNHPIIHHRHHDLASKR